MSKPSKLNQKINFFISRAIIGFALLSCVILFALVLSKPSHGNVALNSESSLLSSLSTDTPLVAPSSFIEVASTEDLLALFEKHDFEVHPTAADEIVAENPVEVPALFLATLPNDFANKLTIQEKKALFIRSLLPLILDANAEIEAERAELLAIKSILSSQKSLTAEQVNRLDELAEKYRIKRFDVTQIDDLLRKVDVIPVAMAMGQAIEETGWGQSYAARMKNATHGVTLPSGVKAYASLQESVRAYMRNLNANPAYRKMRDIRACLRSENKELCGIKMMDGLYHYSELRNAYIHKVKSHIRRHNLSRFDDYQLKTDIEITAKA